MTRRKFFQSATLAVAGSSMRPAVTGAEDKPASPLKGNIRHSACRWCYGKIPLTDLCAAGKEMGLAAIDLLNPPEFETVKKYSLVCSMVSFPTIDGLGGIAKAFNRVEPTGYKGYVAQEFVPKRPDALASLRQAVKLCDV